MDLCGGVDTRSTRGNGLGLGLGLERIRAPPEAGSFEKKGKEPCWCWCWCQAGVFSIIIFMEQTKLYNCKEHIYIKH